MRSCKHTNTIIYRGKQHCNVSKANIGLLEHVHCTVHVCPTVRKCLFHKVQIQAANLQNQKFKNCLHWSTHSALSSIKHAVWSY